jgi:TPP-dependent pyruvate/acetoin dehydrogenase alpha subunit
MASEKSSKIDVFLDGQARPMPNYIVHTKEQLQEAYAKMMRIRKGEEKIRELQTTEPGTLHQWVHSSEGEEACSVGVAMAMRLGDLQTGDVLEGTHRSHGYPIAMGVDLKAWMAELFAKATGTNKGRGGTMHLADVSIGMMGSNGVVGMCTKPIGAAMVFKMTGSDRVGISITGDGGTNNGTFLEGLNLASIHDLPVVFVVTNNHFQVGTPAWLDNACLRKGGNISDRAAGFAMKGLTVDGNDFFEVNKAAKYCIERARKGEGPSMLELVTYRQRSHCYTEFPHEVNMWPAESPDELAYWMRKDPIRRFEREVLDAGLLTQEELETIRKQVDKEIEEAVEFARQSPFPDPEEVYRDIYA